MNKIILSLIGIVILCSSYECNKTKSGKLKGKLVIKELCSHFVVQVINGSADTSRVTNGWKDEKRKVTFDNVFTVGNRCDFPANLNEGDEFEFSFDPNPPPQNCAVCMAYYPTPGKINAIKIHSEK
jgi:hypothetical protein